MRNQFLKYYKEYGQYVNKLRMIPNFMDCLRPVERRVLYALYLEAKDKFKKSAYIVGKSNILHPHGDQSIYQSLVKLVRNNFADGQGNWGSKYGLNDLEPAAMRYTECRLNNVIKKISFSFLDYTDFDILEIEKEPLYLPSLIPPGLLFKELNSGIGFGIKTIIPSYKIDDLIKRLLYLKNIIKNEVIIYPYYEDNETIGTPEEAKKLLTTGIGTFGFKPKILIDKNKRKITILGRKILNNFNSLISSLEKEIESSIIYILDLSKNSTNIEIGIVKNKKYDFDKLIEIVDSKIISNISYKVYVCDNDGNIFIKSIDDILLQSFSNIFKSFNLKILSEINDKKNILNEYEIIVKLRPFIKNDLKKNDFIYEDFLLNVSKKLDIDKEIIKNILSKYNIKSLLNVVIDIEKIKSEILELEKLQNNEKVVIDLYKNI